MDPEAAPPYKTHRPDADQYPTVETLRNVGLIMQALATTPLRVLRATNRPRPEPVEAAWQQAIEASDGIDRRVPVLPALLATAEELWQVRWLVHPEIGPRRSGAAAVWLLRIQGAIRGLLSVRLSAEDREAVIRPDSAAGGDRGARIVDLARPTLACERQRGAL